MRNLSKVLIFLFLISFSSTSFAQKRVSSDGGGGGSFFLYGWKGGLNVSNMLSKDSDDKYSDNFSPVVGFHFGPVVGFAFTDLIGLQTGTILSSKGFKWVEEPNDYETYTLTLNPLYLEIPVLVKFVIPAGGINIYADVGPCLGIGLGGKMKLEYDYEGDVTSDDRDIEWGSDAEEHDLKRMVLGLHAGAGVQIKFIIVGFHSISSLKKDR